MAARGDDAAGECFDKAARVLGLGYPGGAAIDRLSREGDPTRYPLPRAQIDGAPFDMSFSGLKTAVVNLAHNAAQKGEALDRPSLAASLCAAVSDTLVPRAIAAVRHAGRHTLVVAGGVAANSVIRQALSRQAEAQGIRLMLAPLPLCGDNAAMIGCQAYYEYRSGARADSSLNAAATWPVDRPF